jgi:hypothetical protein
MSELLGKDFLIYTRQYSGDFSVIGCEESCTVSLSAQELITTTKGSGRATNRELGRYDWQITSQNVLIQPGNVIGTENFIDPLRKGQKVLVKAQMGTIVFDAHQSTLFGRGVVTNIEYTGNAEGFATANITIKADGPLYLPNDLQDTFADPGYYEVTTSGTTSVISSVSIFDKELAWVVVDDNVLNPTAYDYLPDNGYSSGVITFDDSIATGKLIQVFFQ